MASKSRDISRTQCDSKDDQPDQLARDSASELTPAEAVETGRSGHDDADNSDAEAFQGTPEHWAGVNGHGEPPPGSPEPHDRQGDDLIAIGPGPDRAEDEELREILEHLNNTLESANTVLAGNHALAESIATPDPIVPVETENSSRWSAIGPPVVAAAMGVILGVVALVLLWPVWNADNRRIGEAVKDPARISETIIERRPALAPPDGETASVAPDRAPSEPVVAVVSEAASSPIAPVPEPTPEAGHMATVAAVTTPAPAVAEMEPQAEPPQLETAAAAAQSAPDELKTMPEPETGQLATVATVAEPAPAAAETAPEASVPQPGPLTATAQPAPDEPELKPEPEPRQGEIVTAAIPAAPPPEPLSETEEASLTERGRALTGIGDVVSARLIFGYAARRGSAEAMFSLAQTYDPDYLAQWQVHGLKGDVSAALEWYAQAAEAGHELARERIRTLNGRFPG